MPGHELVGEVVAIPEDEKVWKVGDRVGGPWHGGHDGTPSKIFATERCKRLVVSALGLQRDARVPYSATGC